MSEETGLPGRSSSTGNGEPTSTRAKLSRLGTALTPRRAAILVGVVVAALIAALVVTNLDVTARPAITSSEVNNIVQQKVSTAITQLQSEPSTAASVYHAAEYGIVVVESLHKGGPMNDELGTGIVIDQAGDILTALHVVQGGSSIKVTFADGSESSAAIKTADAADDIAVLTPSTPPSVIAPEVLGPAPGIGDPVFAVGDPLGLDGSLTAGVVSGLDRSFLAPSGRTLTGLIQFDAAVNPGSSGGPLLNAKGQVVGIVIGLANPSGSDSFSGIGFAVTIATAGGSAGVPQQ